MIDIYVYYLQYMMIGYDIFKYKIVSHIQCIAFMFEIFSERDILLTKIVYKYELLNVLWYKIIHELLNELQYAILYLCMIV